MESSPSLRHTPEHAGATITADSIVCARTIDASNDVLAAAEGWAHCGHPSKRDCKAASWHLTYSIYTAKL